MKTKLPLLIWSLILTVPFAGFGQDTRELVKGPASVEASELENVLTQVEQLLAPFKLADVSGPPPETQGGTIMIGSVVTPTRSASRDDGTVITVMSAHEGPDAPPANLGVWHGTAKNSGFAGVLSGNIGKLKLRLFGPSTDKAAQPFGFTEVSLFDAGSETEYTLEADGWVVRHYVGAEE